MTNLDKFVELMFAFGISRYDISRVLLKLLEDAAGDEYKIEIAEPISTSDKWSPIQNNVE